MIVIDPAGLFLVADGHTLGETVFEEDEKPEYSYSNIMNSKGEYYMYYSPRQKLGFDLSCKKKEVENEC